MPAQQQQQQQQQRRPAKRMLPCPSLPASGGDTGGRASKRVTFSDEWQKKRPASALYSIFNFFESVTPPPTFATFMDSFLHVAKVMESHQQFLHGLLLKNTEPDDKFPFLSYTVFHTEALGTFVHDPYWVKLILEGYSQQQMHHQGGFKELHSLWTDQRDVGLHSVSRRPRSEDSVYIVVSYRLVGNARSLEADWQRWSGANCILEQLGEQQLQELRRITFYRRAAARGSFSHLLLAEFHSAADIFRLRDFVAELNGRHCGMAGLYTVEVDFGAG